MRTTGHRHQPGSSAGTDHTEQYKSTQGDRCVLRRNCAALALLVEVELRPRPYGPDELTLLATAPRLNAYLIIVVDANRAYARFAYLQRETLLGLLHKDGHYDALTSLPAFFGKSYLCSQCLRPYNQLGQHACPNNQANHCRGSL